MSSRQSTKSDALQRLAQEVLSARIGRREFLQRATALGLSASAAGAFLAACGSSPQSSTKAPPPASAKKGGTLAVGPFGDPQNYDPATNNADFPEIPFPPSTRASRRTHRARRPVRRRRTCSPSRSRKAPTAGGTTSRSSRASNSTTATGR